MAGVIVRRLRDIPPDTKLFVRAVNISAQNATTGAGIGASSASGPAENFFASSLLIWRLGPSFRVAATNERTDAFPGASFSFSKLAGVGSKGDQSADKPSVRDALLRPIGVTPPFVGQAMVPRNIAALHRENPRITHRRSVRRLHIAFRGCARSTLSKMENEARSETASARAVVSPRRNTTIRVRGCPPLQRSATADSAS